MRRHHGAASSLMVPLARGRSCAWRWAANRTRSPVLCSSAPARAVAASSPSWPAVSDSSASSPPARAVGDGWVRVTPLNHNLPGIYQGTR